MSDAAKAEELARQMITLLEGNRPEVIGAALGNVLSLWVAGHVVPGDPEATMQLRARWLAFHVIEVIEERRHCGRGDRRRVRGPDARPRLARGFFLFMWR